MTAPKNRQPRVPQAYYYTSLIAHKKGRFVYRLICRLYGMEQQVSDK